jgi:hypothetical protein
MGQVNTTRSCTVSLYTENSQGRHSFETVSFVILFLSTLVCHFSLSLGGTFVLDLWGCLSSKRVQHVERFFKR